MTRGKNGAFIVDANPVRIENWLLMALMLLPLIVAAAVDGWTQRAVAQQAGTYINPVRFNIGFHILHISSVLPFVFVAIPLSVHPMFFAIYWLMAAVGVYTAVKHLHHRI